MTDLRKVPGIGAEKEKELRELGYDSLASLKDADADALYARAEVLQGHPLDKCVLYAFRCAVAYARDPFPDPMHYRWWNFTDAKIRKDTKSQKLEGRKA